MQINFTYQGTPAPTDIVRVIIYTARNPTVVVATQDYPPPHINPRDVSIFVPTPQVHIVKIYETPDVGSIGILTSEYVSTPSFSENKITAPLEIIVGLGREGRDPVDGADGVDIPSIDGITISWVEQKGSGPLTKLEDVEEVDPTLAEWTVRDGGGIDLLNGKQFNEGERYWLYFEPYIDSNITATIFDLTTLLEAHITNVNNPHAVTKGQIGLSVIPNAKSDLINLNSSDTLATSAAVNALRLTIVNRILSVGRFNLGTIPGSSDQIKTVAHGLNITDPYVVIGNLRGYGANWNADNDTFAGVRELTANDFKVTLRNVSGASANLYFDYMLIKV